MWTPEPCVLPKNRYLVSRAQIWQKYLYAYLLWYEPFCGVRVLIFILFRVIIQANIFFSGHCTQHWMSPCIYLFAQVRRDNFIFTEHMGICGLDFVYKIVLEIHIWTCWTPFAIFCSIFADFSTVIQLKMSKGSKSHTMFGTSKEQEYLNVKIQRNRMIVELAGWIHEILLHRMEPMGSCG